MLNIKLDDKAYDITTVSDEAKAQLAGFKFVDARLQQQQGQTAALQTDSYKTGTFEADSTSAPVLLPSLLTAVTKVGQNNR